MKLIPLLIVLDAVAPPLLWPGARNAAVVGRGPISFLPKSWRRWLTRKPALTNQPKSNGSRGFHRDSPSEDPHRRGRFDDPFEEWTAQMVQRLETGILPREIYRW